MTDTAGGATAYDIVAYPALAIPRTHPDHLATIARLHGLSPPPVKTARVLDIGGGDGTNLLAMAELLPDARFLSIDLSPTAVARGRAMAAASGIGNVAIEVADILDCASLEGPFDYVIAHGLYAWVPQAVRQALLPLVGRVLSPDGVAYVSYNALPGGYHRRILREMTLHEVGGIADPAERTEAAQLFLRAFAEPREVDHPTVAPLRPIAARMIAKEAELLFHDELSDHYEPQAFKDVVADGTAHGLRFLNDAEPSLLMSAMPDPPLGEAALIHAIQRDDYADACLFHKTLFVRDGQAPARTPALAAVRDLFMSAECERTGPNRFEGTGTAVTISDERLADAVGVAARAWPQRVRVGDLIDDELRLRAIVRLFVGEAIGLHTLPYAGAATPGERPRAGRLARAFAAAGHPVVFTLDHRAVELDDPSARELLRLLDGTRDRAAIAAAWTPTGAAENVGIEAALARFAAMSLLLQ